MKIQKRLKTIIGISVGLVMGGAACSIAVGCGHSSKPSTDTDTYIPNEVVQQDISRQEDDFYSQLIKKYEKYNEMDAESAKAKALGVVKGLDEAIAERDNQIQEYMESDDFKDLSPTQQEQYKGSLEQSKLGYVKNQREKLGIDSFDTVLFKYEFEQMQVADESNYGEKGKNSKEVQEIDKFLSNVETKSGDTVISDLEAMRMLQRQISEDMSLSVEERTQLDLDLVVN
jgi:hypothetical protein